MSVAYDLPSGSPVINEIDRITVYASPGELAFIPCLNIEPDLSRSPFVSRINIASKTPFFRFPSELYTAIRYSSPSVLAGSTSLGSLLWSSPDIIPTDWVIQIFENDEIGDSTWQNVGTGNVPGRISRNIPYGTYYGFPFINRYSPFQARRSTALIIKIVPKETLFLNLFSSVLPANSTLPTRGSDGKRWGYVGSPNGNYDDFGIIGAWDNNKNFKNDTYATIQDGQYYTSAPGLHVITESFKNEADAAVYEQVYYNINSVVKPVSVNYYPVSRQLQSNFQSPDQVWDSNRNYQIGDVVFFNNTGLIAASVQPSQWFYRCLQLDNIGIPPNLGTPNDTWEYIKYNDSNLPDNAPTLFTESISDYKIPDSFGTPTVFYQKKDSSFPETSTPPTFAGEYIVSTKYIKSDGTINSDVSVIEPQNNIFYINLGLNGDIIQTPGFLDGNSTDFLLVSNDGAIIYTWVTVTYSEQGAKTEVNYSVAGADQSFSLAFSRHNIIPIRVVFIAANTTNLLINLGAAQDSLKQRNPPEYLSIFWDIRKSYSFSGFKPVKSGLKIKGFEDDLIFDTQYAFLDSNEYQGSTASYDPPNYVGSFPSYVCYLSLTDYGRFLLENMQRNPKIKPPSCKLRISWREDASGTIVKKWTYPFKMTIS